MDLRCVCFIIFSLCLLLMKLIVNRKACTRDPWWSTRKMNRVETTSRKIKDRDKQVLRTCTQHSQRQTRELFLRAHTRTISPHAHTYTRELSRPRQTWEMSLCNSFLQKWISHSICLQCNFWLGSLQGEQKLSNLQTSFHIGVVPSWQRQHNLRFN